jgi:hypothetical protein
MFCDISVSFSSSSSSSSLLKRIRFTFDFPLKSVFPIFFLSLPTFHNSFDFNEEIGSKDTTARCVFRRVALRKIRKSKNVNNYNIR